MIGREREHSHEKILVNFKFLRKCPENGVTAANITTKSIEDGVTAANITTTSIEDGVRAANIATK